MVAVAAAESVPELAPPPGSSDVEHAHARDRTTTDETPPERRAAPRTRTRRRQPVAAARRQPLPPTQQNDTPPPSGSPAERFEQFCQENPGAC